MLSLNLLLLQRRLLIKKMHSSIVFMGKYLNLMREALDAQDMEGFERHERAYLYYQREFDKACEQAERVTNKIEMKVRGRKRG